MIPKIIHFCWFGDNPYPEIVEECMASWKKYCPDFEIRRWDESNFDLNSCEYAKEAYAAKKWAFVADYARVCILYNEGGIYLDTDVEILKPLNDLLNHDAFMGFEHGFGVNSGLIAGAIARIPVFKEHMELYENMTFKKENGTLNLKSCVEYTTEILKNYGLVLENRQQCVAGITIYPKEYFCPQNQYTGKVQITSKAYTLHKYIGTWADETVIYGKRLKTECLDSCGLFVGILLYVIKYSVYVFKKDGIYSLVKKIIRKLDILLFRR